MPSFEGDHRSEALIGLGQTARSTGGYDFAEQAQKFPVSTGSHEENHRRHAFPGLDPSVEQVVMTCVRRLRPEINLPGCPRPEVPVRS